MTKSLLLFLFLLLIFSCSHRDNSNKNLSANDDEELKALLANEPFVFDTIAEFSDDCPDRRVIVTGQTKYFVMRNAFYFKDKDLKKGNAALVISNKDEIEENEKLFINNHIAYISPCGYHYFYEFWYSCDSILMSDSYTVDCIKGYCFNRSAINDKLLKYHELITKSPTHYIYNLKIRVKYPYKQVIATLQNDGNIALYYNNTNSETKYPKYYDIELFDVSDDLEAVKKKMKKYDFISEITEYDP